MEKWRYIPIRQVATLFESRTVAKYFHTYSVGYLTTLTTEDVVSVK
jgi:hypothetical protein